MLGVIPQHYHLSLMHLRGLVDPCQCIQGKWMEKNQIHSLRSVKSENGGTKMASKCKLVWVLDACGLRDLLHRKEDWRCMRTWCCCSLLKWSGAWMVMKRTERVPLSRRDETCYHGDISHSKHHLSCDRGSQTPLRKRAQKWDHLSLACQGQTHMLK